MTTIEQLTELKAGLREELAKWDGVERLGVAWKASKDGYSVWGRFNICYGCDDDVAICIASSRTVTPLLLKMMLDEVEWLEKMEQTKQASISAVQDRLNAIYEAWKGGMEV